MLHVSSDARQTNSGIEGDTGLIVFFYTMIVLACASFISGVSFAALVITHQKVFAFATAAYLFYFFDVALVFRTAHISPPPHSSLGVDLYSITSPVESVLLGAGVFGCLWAMQCRFLERSMRSAKIAVALFVLGSTFAYIAIDTPRDQEFIFFTMRSLTMLAMVVFGVCVFMRTSDRMERKRLLTHMPLALYTFFGALGTAIWNTYFIYLRSALRVPGPPPFMPERNFVENAIILGIGLWVVLVAVRRLQLFYERTPARPTPAREKFLENKVSLFAARFSLSTRESEILTEIVRGKSYPAIAAQLYISPSTVKVHVHNILRKTSHRCRDQLVHDFWHEV